MNSLPSRRKGGRRDLWTSARPNGTSTHPGYAVTDAGFYFGTQLVATKTGSEALGLCTACAYAILMTWLVMSLARKVQWQPQGVYAGRLLGLGSWLVCYAWWYPWQEVLYQIQGYGLWNLKIGLASSGLLFACPPANAFFTGSPNACIRMRAGNLDRPSCIHLAGEFLQEFDSN